MEKVRVLLTAEHTQWDILVALGEQRRDRNAGHLWEARWCRPYTANTALAAAEPEKGKDAR